MTSTRAWRASLLLASAAACTPALDWREVHVDGRALVASFPCKPERRSRPLALGADKVTFAMASCAVGGSTYAIGYADVADPAAVGGALVALRRSAADNLQAPAPKATAVAVPGMTPNADAGRIRLDGRLPDRSTVVEHAAFFVHGLRVYQASVLGAAPVEGAVESFFSALRLAA